MKVGDKIHCAAWCEDCKKNNWDAVVTKVGKKKSGRYYPYRDSMDSEKYTYIKITVKCQYCDKDLVFEGDHDYETSESDVDKFGSRGANYGC